MNFQWYDGLSKEAELLESRMFSFVEKIVIAYFGQRFK